MTLVAELPISSFKVVTDQATKLYKLHFALLALVKDAAGKTVERVSQDYPFQGPLDKLPQLQQGNVVFKRKLVVPPGSYTLELVAQDRDSAATSVHRAPLVVPAGDGLAISCVVIVRRMEPAPPAEPGAPEDPLRGEALRIVPSLDDPISKAATAKLPVYVVVYPAPGASTPPQMTLEFSSDGKAEGRNSVVLPAPDADGRIRFLAPIPIRSTGPGATSSRSRCDRPAPRPRSGSLSRSSRSAPEDRRSRREVGLSSEPFTNRMDPMRGASRLLHERSSKSLEFDWNRRPLNWAYPARVERVANLQ